MNRTIQIVIAAALGIALVLSMAGNIYLGVSLSKMRKQADTIKGQLNTTNKKLSETKSELSKTKSELSKSQENLKTIASELATMVEQVGELNNKYTEASDALENIMCPVTIFASDVILVSTNQSLLDPITEASEKYYFNSSVKTNYELLWNNSKTAMFTITWPDNTTSKVLASWNGSDVEAIIDANNGCYFYAD